MKTLLPILFPLMVLTSLAQPDTCIRSRWIAVDADLTGDWLFDMSNDSSFVLKVCERINGGKRLFYFEGADILDTDTRSYPGKSRIEFTDTTYLSGGFTYTDQHVWVGFSPTAPLLSHDGEDQMVHCGGLAFCYLFPPDTGYIFSTGIEELRIREDCFRDASGRIAWRATGVAFYSSYNDHYAQPLWIDLDALFDGLENAEAYPWYQFFTQREYKGEQYMQTGCHSYARKIVYSSEE